MPTEILMPKVDMVMESGTFVEWLKQEGDPVEKGEALFVIMTDKAAIECEAPADGILAKTIAAVDDVIPVNGLVGYITQPGESLEGLPAAKVEAPAGRPEQEAPEARPALEPSSPKADGKLVRATPLARTVAKELGIDLSQVSGRGPRGRIYRADVLEFSQAQPAAAVALQPPAFAAAGLETPLPDARVRQRVALKGARAVIANRLSYSAATIPHINESLSVDMSEAVRLRERVNAEMQPAGGKKVSYTAILALATARALMRHPYLNSSLDGEEVLLWEDVHLGIATALEDYLIVPVIRQAHTKDLKTISTEMAELVEKARARKLQPSEMSGSTFTISNLGMHGIESFTAIINPPETAILAVGRMIDTPVAIQGQVSIRPMLTLTVAADHRVNDGARVAAFLVELKKVLENPYLLL